MELYTEALINPRNMENEMTQLSQAEITEMQMEAEVLSGRLFDPTDYGWFRHAEDHGTPWDEVFEAGQSMRRLRPRSNDWK